MKALLDLPAPSYTLDSIRNFSDKSEVYIRGLESLGQCQDTYGSLLIPVMLGKLPITVKSNITRENGNDDWTLGNLRKAIQREISIQEASTNGRETYDIPTASFHAGIGKKNGNYNIKEFSSTSITYEDGKYVAKLPWIEECPELPTNEMIARARTHRVVNRLNQEPNLFKIYGDIIKEQEKRGFIEKIKENEDEPQRIHYIPHHPVKKDSTTTPIRIVYDCSCKENAKSPSLNDCLHSYPPISNDITELLTRFRTQKFAVTTDIEKAFLQVGLHKSDRDVTRFFWLSDPTDSTSPFTTYRFKSVLFGATCSPFILNATLLKHFEENPSPTASRITQDLYVDNVLTSFTAEDDLMQFYRDSRCLLQKGGFNLRSWNSNSNRLRELAETENVLDSSNEVNILGMRWNVADDKLLFAEVDIDSTMHAYDEFESLIKTEMKDKLSTHKSHVGTKRRKYKPYWNEELGSLWKKVCETEKIWLRFTGHSSKKRTLKEDYCHNRKTFDRLNRKYKRQYQLQQQQTLEDKLSNMNQKDFWKSIGKIGIANERKRAIPLAVVDNCGNVTNDKSNVLNIWKNDFETLFKRNEDINDHLDTTICNTEIDVSALNEAISREEVVKAVIHAKLRKAAGIDDIPAEVLKNEAAIDLLFKIISGCFNLGKLDS
ncbi:Hypothetical predicted protein [Mytilus galloprovincialis]|uniref:Reverse transcriptase domain-containing protein n=1 Tax=Mytilus galloprovincialis TaxID=29158 RepID=A0A8B6C457_MYTGA|nr:Hypothetical predicted protein [Mytilus galloprovincialis]